MTNVLPAETIKVESDRFKSRLILVGALVCITTAALSALTLLPSQIALEVAYTTAGRQSPAAPATAPATNNQQEADRAAVARAQAVLLNVQPFAATTSPTEAITAALALRPKDVHVDRISFLAAGTGTITISGSSQARESISAYRDALAASGQFKSATVPVGALVGTEGGKFTITLTGII